MSCFWNDENGSIEFRRGEYGYISLSVTIPNFQTGLGDKLDTSDKEVYFIAKENINDPDEKAIINKKAQMAQGQIVIQLLPHETNYFWSKENSFKTFLYSLIMHKSDGTTQVLMPRGTNDFPTIKVYPALDDTTDV